MCYVFWCCNFNKVLIWNKFIEVPVFVQMHIFMENNIFEHTCCSKVMMETLKEALLIYLWKIVRLMKCIDSYNFGLLNYEWLIFMWVKCKENYRSMPCWIVVNQPDAKYNFWYQMLMWINVAVLLAFVCIVHGYTGTCQFPHSWMTCSH